MGKQKCLEKRNFKWSQAYSLICKACKACMAVSGTGPLNFTDDLIYDDSRMSLEGCKTISSTNIQENATRISGKCFILHQNIDPKQPCQFSQGIYNS